MYSFFLIFFNYGNLMHHPLELIQTWKALVTVMYDSI